MVYEIHEGQPKRFDELASSEGLKHVREKLLGRALSVPQRHYRFRSNQEGQLTTVATNSLQPGAEVYANIFNVAFIALSGRFSSPDGTRLLRRLHSKGPEFLGRYSPVHRPRVL